MTDYLSVIANQVSAYGAPSLEGLLRQSPEDFFVDEVLGFEPEGEGEHVFVHIEKTASNTQFIAEQLAAFAGVSINAVSFSGMKDRWAVTRQWFSVQMPGKASPDFSELNNDEVSVLAVSRHPRKLRRGVHRANRFRIRLRDIKGDREDFEQRIALISQQGVPNYFGEQRFGHGARNLNSAERWFAGAFKPRRKQQGIFLSAARSFLFNQVLSQRVRHNNWQQFLAGDLFMLEGTHSIFASDDDIDIEARLKQGDVHSTGPLYGRASKLASSGEAADLEATILEPYAYLLAGLEKQGLTAERRALRLIPKGLGFQFIEKDCVEITFELPTGCFATALMAELAQYQNMDRQEHNKKPLNQ